MKKKFYLLSLLLTLTAQAQIVSIPDANFKAKLLQANSSNTIASSETPVYNSNNFSNDWSAPSYNSIDTNNDGEIQVTEARAIKWLSFPVSNISNLTGIEAFTNLQYLNCSSTGLTTLNVSGLSNLLYLNCSNSLLTNLNVSGLSNLQYLTCSYNGLTTLNVSGLSNLQELGCIYNQLTTLNVSGLTNLQKLNCTQNQLTTLNFSGCTNLQKLYCTSNQFTTLNVSSLSNLQELGCTNNQLTTLNVSGCTNLQKLYCASNQLSTLNISDLSNLRILWCFNNPLTALNVSTLSNLQDLDCYNNTLTTLNVSGLSNLQELRCSNNQLTTLFIKRGNNSWSNLEFSNNPNLQYICTEESDITLVQSKINSYGLNNTCNVNSYCSFTPGSSFFTINGNNRFDTDNNGCTTSDLPYPNLKINMSNGTQTGSLIANGLGNFTIPVLAGTHTLSPVIENPSYFNVSPSTATVSFPLQSSPFTQNFCITPNGVHHDVEAALFPLNPARPGFDVNYKIIYKNKGTSVANGAVIFNFDDCHQIADYITAAPTPDVVAFNGLTFNYTNLQPFEIREINVTLNVNSPMEIPAVNAGDYLSIIANITSAITDENISNNTSNIMQIVVNSFDPNDKTCLEGPTINPSKIGDYVTYQIRFENTGTFPAQNIVVKDMIDTTKFDVSTLQIINSSHTCNTKITGNKVEFIFENINLPFADATNDGYVVFKIKSLATLAVNSSVSNSAGIYFDYNFPIITNTATSTYQLLNNNNFEFNSELVLFPNPVKEVVTIKAKNSVEIHSIEFYNIIGQVVLVIPGYTENIDISSLKKGTYFVKLNTNKGITSTKLMKE